MKKMESNKLEGLLSTLNKKNSQNIQQEFENSPKTLHKASKLSRLWA